MAFFGAGRTLAIFKSGAPRPCLVGLHTGEDRLCAGSIRDASLREWNLPSLANRVTHSVGGSQKAPYPAKAQLRGPFLDVLAMLMRNLCRAAVVM